MDTNVRKTITEPAREIPVLMEVDVIVVGGGTTGPIAAIAAARRGKKVVMIERFGKRTSAYTQQVATAANEMGTPQPAEESR